MKDPAGDPEKPLDPESARRKREALVRIVKRRGPLLVAFSGGMDSAFLLAVSHEVLGDEVLAATAQSIIHPPGELEEARAFTAARGIRHVVFQSEEMHLPEFLSNDPDRCYHCKRHLLDILFRLAREDAADHVAHGANVDDTADYRPGQRAADERGAISPLLEARLNKEEIRFLSREMGLPTWDKLPSPCLATRIPYGTPVTPERLNRIREAEAFLLKMGLKRVRVRHHETVARIETDKAEMENILTAETREAIVKRFREIGFDHVALDLEGYKSGKLNRGIVSGVTKDK